MINLAGFSRKHLLITALAIVLAILVIILIASPRLNRYTKTPESQKAATLHTPIIETGFTATGFQAPTGIATTPIATDKRLFVLEQNGLIRLLGTDHKHIAEPFLDLTKKVKRTDEMGLLGLAFHPSYAKNGYFYVNYNDQDMNTVISRFKVSAQANKGDPASEKVLLKFKQPYQNHNGGDMAFGPGGYLYISSGDGGWAGDPHDNGQNKDSFLGKILRIDVNKGDPYAVPSTNPFVGQTGVKPEIWAYGLRNPWRISFDSKTGDLYIGDVGEKSIEELNFQKASSKGGENYGWRCYEGTRPYDMTKCNTGDTYTKPVIEYAHEDRHCSITGGYVYRGRQNPALQGKYFYADFCTGDIYYAGQKSGKWQAELALKTPYAITTFGQAYNGDIYFADASTGSIYKIRDVAN